MKKTNLVWGLLPIFCLLFINKATAQLKTPAPSPFCKIEQQVGLTDVSIEYSRPNMRGRKIVGDLIPYGELWRTGANTSTKISFSDNVKLNGHEVPAGKYALYTIPGQDAWTVVIHKNLNHWGTGGNNYKQEEDLVRFEVKTVQTPLAVETFTISIGDLSDESASILISWENTAIPIQLETEVESRVLAQIDQILAGPDAGTYYQMASYYYSLDKDTKQALEWVNKSLEGSERYWVMTLKARLHARLGQYKEAIEASTKALKLAEGNNPDYVRMNKKMIAEWKDK